MPAQRLYNTVCADPSAPLAISVVGPGGCGKSALLAALREVYLSAGVKVAGLDAAHLGPAQLESIQSSEMAVLVDDAHQLEGPDLEGLRRFALRGDVRIVIAYRPWPSTSELDRLEGTLSRHQPSVLLGRLNRREAQIRCAALLGRASSAAMIDLLCEQTGGLPALIDRVVSLVRTTSTLDGELSELPWDVVDRVRYDLDRLPRPLRALLLALGLGAAADPEILAHVLAADPGVVAEQLSMARAHGLLLDDDRLIPVVRQALLAGAAPGTRRVVQRLVFEAHLERGRPVLTVVQQLIEGGARGSDLAAVLESAGDAALSDSALSNSVPMGPDAAAQAAQRYAQAVTAGADQTLLAARHAEASALAGDLDSALRLADLALSDPSCPDRARAGSVAAAVLARRGLLARSAEVYRWVGSARMASAAPLAALALLGTGALTQAQEVLAESDGDRPPTLVAGAESLMASGILESVLASPAAGSITASVAALSTLTRAAALLEPGGRAVLLPDTPAALAAIVALHSGEFDVAVSVLERALERGAGGVFARARHQLLLAWTAMIRGNGAVARRWLAETVPGSGGLEPREELFAVALAVGLARRDGDIPALQAAWPAARAAIIRHPVDLFSLLPLGELAVAAARLREFDRVAPHLEQARILLERLVNPPLWAVPLHWYCLHAEMLREHPDAARAHAVTLMEAAPSSHYAAALAAAGHAWMQVLAGNFDSAEVEFAARGLASVGLADDGSRLAGQAAIRTTDRKAMVGLLGCARALQASGPGVTHPAEDVAGDDLPDTVPTSSPATAPGGTPMLSDREREVAELILTGLTYRQIGERLFISAKTVEHHVARMRQRLDVTSRDELFAQLRLFVGTSVT
jgi:DNA-binding CsgD family transcriptional regulator